jgi:prepilin-type N-terminal cleavage/methylation domain-containing protein
MSKVTRLLRSAREEHGFTLMELLVAMMLTSIGIISMVSAFDGSRELSTTAEKNEVASHIAERELEKALALDFDVLGITPPFPTTSSDPNHPDYYVTGSAYRWEHKPGGQSEPLVTGSLQATTSWSKPIAGSEGARLTGRIHRYVTTLPESVSLKRVTVAVTVDGDGLTKPVVISSIAADHEAVS